MIFDPYGYDLRRLAEAPALPVLYRQQTRCHRCLPTRSEPSGTG